jgi:hypothetical protein
MDTTYIKIDNMFQSKSHLLIEVKGGFLYLNGRSYSSKKVNKDLIGNTILNLLFYNNREGKVDYTLIIDKKDETESFKKQVKAEYQNIKNTSLRDSFFKYAKIEN